MRNCEPKHAILAGDFQEDGLGPQRDDFEDGVQVVPTRDEEGRGDQHGGGAHGLQEYGQEQRQPDLVGRVLCESISEMLLH